LSTILSMIALNVPLSQWRTFLAEGRTATAWHQGKNTDKTAQAIYRQLSHPEVVTLVAEEFDQLAPDLRIALRTLCNGANCSGNVTKGVQRLNELMKGKLLREEVHVDRFQRQNRDGTWKSTAVNPAVAGATRKYGIIKK